MLKGRSKSGCEPEVVDLSRMRHRSNEFIINVDSKTEIQVSYKNDTNKVCTVVRKQNSLPCASISEYSFYNDSQRRSQQGSRNESIMFGGKDTDFCRCDKDRKSEKRSSTYASSYNNGNRQHGNYQPVKRPRAKENDDCDLCAEFRQEKSNADRSTNINKDRKTYEDSCKSMFQDKPYEAPCKKPKESFMKHRERPCPNSPYEKDHDPCNKYQDEYQKPRVGKSLDVCQCLKSVGLSDKCTCPKVPYSDKGKPCYNKDMHQSKYDKSHKGSRMTDKRALDLLKKYPCLTPRAEMANTNDKGVCPPDPCKSQREYSTRESHKQRHDICKDTGNEYKHDPYKAEKGVLDTCKPKQKNSYEPHRNADPCQPNVKDPCKSKGKDPAKPKYGRDPCKLEYDHDESDPCQSKIKDPCKPHYDTDKQGPSKTKYSQGQSYPCKPKYGQEQPDPCQAKIKDPCKPKPCPDEPDPCQIKKQHCDIELDHPKKRPCPPEPCKTTSDHDDSSPIDSCRSSYDPCTEICEEFKRTGEFGDTEVCDISKAGTSSTDENACKDTISSGKDDEECYILPKDTSDKSSTEQNDLQCDITKDTDTSKEIRTSFGPGSDDEVWLVYAPKAAGLKRLTSAQIKLGAKADDPEAESETAQVICDTKLYPKERPIEMTTEANEKRKLEAVGAIKMSTDFNH